MSAGSDVGDLGLTGSEADEVFTALADRTRRRILVCLAQHPGHAGAVADHLQLSRQAVAKHLQVLTAAGIVHVTSAERRRIHRVDPARIRELSDLLDVVARGWDRRLVDIRDRAEAEQRRRDENP